MVGMQQWRITAIVYLLQLCLALTLGMQVHGVLESSIGHSLELNKLLHGYDHTIITDFLKVHGASITPLIGQLRWLLMVWVLFSVFMDAGSLYCISTAQTSGRTFWQGAATYFFPFLKISLLFLLFALLWTIFLWVPVALFFEPSLEYFSSEKFTVWLVICILGLYLFGLMALFIWAVISRSVNIRKDVSTGNCLRIGWRSLQKEKYCLTGVMLAFAALQIGIWSVYWLVEAITSINTPLLILLFFLMQQGIVFSRIQIRQMMFAGVCNLSEDLQNA